MSSVWTVLETLDAADDDDGVSELNSCQRPHVLFWSDLQRPSRVRCGSACEDHQYAIAIGVFRVFSGIKPPKCCYKNLRCIEIGPEAVETHKV